MSEPRASGKEGLKVLGATLQQLLSNEQVVQQQVPFWIKYACKAMLAKGTPIICSFIYL